MRVNQGMLERPRTFDIEVGHARNLQALGLQLRNVRQIHALAFQIDLCFTSAEIVSRQSSNRPVSGLQMNVRELYRVVGEVYLRSQCLDWPIVQSSFAQRELPLAMRITGRSRRLHREVQLA